MIDLLEKLRQRPEFRDVRTGHVAYMFMLQPDANHEKFIMFTAINKGTSYTIWLNDINYQELPETRVYLPADEAVKTLETYTRQLRKEAAST